MKPGPWRPARIVGKAGAQFVLTRQVGVRHGLPVMEDKKDRAGRVRYFATEAEALRAGR